jgi:endonuclease/exonuclease/phosphatase family metal-dependent hydrolase
VVREHAVDVVALQEVTSEFLGALTAALDGEYAFSSTLAEPGAQWYGMALGVRRAAAWASPPRFVPFRATRMGRGYCVATLPPTPELPLGCRVATTHLESGPLNAAARAPQAAQLRDELAAAVDADAEAALPLLVAGDTNFVTDDEALPPPFAELGATGSMRSLHSYDGATNKRAAPAHRSRLDRVYGVNVPPHLGAHLQLVGDDRISDHYGVLLTLRVRPRAAAVDA